jgi:hypothetical protein
VVGAGDGQVAGGGPGVHNSQCPREHLWWLTVSGGSCSQREGQHKQQHKGQGASSQEVPPVGAATGFDPGSQKQDSGGTAEATAPSPMPLLEHSYGQQAHCLQAHHRRALSPAHYTTTCSAIVSSPCACPEPSFHGHAADSGGGTCP